jgi:predicted transcriptional regulator of viral defense system
LYQSGFKLYRLKTLRDVLGITPEVSFKNVVKRLIKAEVIRHIERDKYLLEDSQISDWELANFMYQPSYVSFESALNHYGILSQFPQAVTSATPKKTVDKQVDGQLLTYSHLSPSLYWGYSKHDNVLVAEPEKALLDQLYLHSKGLKQFNHQEYDLAGIDRQLLQHYWQRFPQNMKTSKITALVTTWLA